MLKKGCIKSLLFRHSVTAFEVHIVIRRRFFHTELMKWTYLKSSRFNALSVAENQEVDGGVVWGEKNACMSLKT